MLRIAEFVLYFMLDVKLNVMPLLLGCQQLSKTNTDLAFYQLCLVCCK